MSDEYTPAAEVAKAVRKKAVAKKNETVAAVNAAGEDAVETVNDLADQAHDALDGAPEKAADTADVVKSKGAAALSAATSTVSGMLPDDIGIKAKGVANDVKDKASDAVEGLAKIIHDSAGAIDDNVGPKYGDYARSAAQSVTDAADRLRAKPVDEIAADTKEFVRTKPGTALGIAAVTGLVLVRILGAVFGKRR